MKSDRHRVKSDQHMAKVKEQLMFEQRSIEQAEERCDYSYYLPACANEENYRAAQIWPHGLRMKFARSKGLTVQQPMHPTSHFFLFGLFFSVTVLRKQREQKQYSKQVQAEKQKERNAAKKKQIESVTNMRKQREKSVSDGRFSGKPTPPPA
eukprot:764395-Pelagomonas_calceolata.AAC.4